MARSGPHYESRGELPQDLALMCVIDEAYTRWPFYGLSFDDGEHLRVNTASIGRILLIADAIAIMLMGVGQTCPEEITDVLVKAAGVMSSILAALGVVLGLLLKGTKKEKAILIIATWIAVLIALCAILFIPIVRVEYMGNAPSIRT